MPIPHPLFMRIALVTLFSSGILWSCARTTSFNGESSKLSLNFESLKARNKLSPLNSHVDAPNLFLLISRSDGAPIENSIPYLYVSRNINQGSSNVEFYLPRGNYVLQVFYISNQHQPIQNDNTTYFYEVDKAYKAVTYFSLTKPVENIQVSLSELSDFISGRVAGRIILGQNQFNQDYGASGNVSYRLKLEPHLPAIPLPAKLTSVDRIVDGWFEGAALYSSGIAGLEYVINEGANESFVFPGRSYYRLDELAGITNSPLPEQRAVSLWVPYTSNFVSDGSSVYRSIRKSQSVVLGYWGPGANSKSVKAISLNPNFFSRAEPIGSLERMHGVARLRTKKENGALQLIGPSQTDFDPSLHELNNPQFIMEELELGINSSQLSEIVQNLKFWHESGTHLLGYPKGFIWPHLSFIEPNLETDYANRLFLNISSMKTYNMSLHFAGFNGIFGLVSQVYSTYGLRHYHTRCDQSNSELCSNHNYLEFQILPNINLTDLENLQIFIKGENVEPNDMPIPTCPELPYAGWNLLNKSIHPIAGNKIRICEDITCSPPLTGLPSYYRMAFCFSHRQQPILNPVVVNSHQAFPQHQYNSFHVLPIHLKVETPPLPNWPSFNGPIYAIVPDAMGGWYVGGDFTMINGLSVGRLAHINSDGSLDSTFNVTINGPVRSLLLVDTNLFVGGSFSMVNNLPRSNLASVDSTTGTLSTWDPRPNGMVRAMVKTDSDIIVAGDFTAINGLSTGSSLWFDLGGDIFNPNPNLVTGWPSVNGTIYTAISDGSGGWFIGGSFTQVGGIARNNVAHITNSKTVSNWNPNANGPVRTLIRSGPLLFVGGDFTAIGGESRNRIAALEIATGNATPWNPNAN
ncbi:MAG: delta-60 repeat domain-containing protein, partial [Bdellovibrionaceae bacterium]|nr:delta-60 repeat domain-containing protein [Pseudobdellovibrionaceae bacterium]